MNNFFRAIIAGYGAKKLGGGCFGTILVFVLIWVALGQCSFSSREVPPPETYPAARRAYIPSIVSPHPSLVPGRYGPERIAGNGGFLMPLLYIAMPKPLNPRFDVDASDCIALRAVVDLPDRLPGIPFQTCPCSADGRT